MHPVIGDAGHHWRVGRAGNDGVDADAAGGQFACHAAGQAHDAGLGRAVMARAFTGHGRSAGNVDYRAFGVGLVHQAHGFTAAQEGAGEVDANHPLPVLVRRFEEGVHRADAGVVDQDVEPTETRLDGSHGRRHRGAVGNVAHQRQGVFAQAFDGLLGSFKIDVGSHHQCTGFGEALDDGPAHTLAGSGDERDFVR
ncbi:hypothetical protein D3C85_1190300 [compost metagenome]